MYLAFDASVYHLNAVSLIPLNDIIHNLVTVEQTQTRMQTLTKD